MPFQSSREDDSLVVVFTPGIRDRAHALLFVGVFVVATISIAISPGLGELNAFEAAIWVLVAVVFACFFSYRESIRVSRQEVAIEASVLGLATTTDTYVLGNARFAATTPVPWFLRHPARPDQYNQVQFAGGRAFGLGMTQDQAAELARELNDFIDEFDEQETGT